MKKLIKTTITLALMTTATFLSGAEKSTLAVLPFTLDDSVREVTIGDVTITGRTLENEFTNQLIDLLVQSRKFKVLDRTKVDKIMNENHLTESDWSLPGQERKIGKLLVADYLVIGDVNRLEFLLKPVDIKITGENTVNVIATLKIQFRVVEVANGQIVFSKTIVEKLKSRQVREEIPVEERKDWTLSDYKDLLFKKTAVKAANAILAGVYPVRIVSISKDGIIVLNRGDGAGVAVGDEFLVFNVGVELKDPDTGESLGHREEKAGTIKVIAIQPKFSTATILETNGSLNINAICRPIDDESQKEKPADYPKATTGW